MEDCPLLEGRLNSWKERWHSYHNDSSHHGKQALHEFAVIFFNIFHSKIQKLHELAHLWIPVLLNKHVNPSRNTNLHLAYSLSLRPNHMAFIANGFARVRKPQLDTWWPGAVNVCNRQASLVTNLNLTPVVSRCCIIGKVKLPWPHDLSKAELLLTTKNSH